MERIKKIASGYIVSLLLMALVYPLTFAGLLLLRDAFRKTDRKTLLRNITGSLFAFAASLPLWIVKVFLGISSYHRVFAITPVRVTPVIYNGVHVAFLAIQLVLLYFIYLSLRELASLLGGPYLRTSGILLMLAVPMHLISIQLYFAVTYTAIALLALSFIRIGQKEVR